MLSDYERGRRDAKSRIIETLERLEFEDLDTLIFMDPRNERRWRYSYAADRLRYAISLIESGEE